ncbi:phosphopantetheine-binding protein [Micromonospora sp. NPDC003197]
MTTLPTDLDTLEKLLIKEIEEETGHQNVTRTGRLNELDMDSLTFSEILMNLERQLGVELDLVETFEIDRETSVADLLRAISAEL